MLIYVKLRESPKWLIFFVISRVLNCNFYMKLIFIDIFYLTVLESGRLGDPELFYLRHILR